jgi:dolichol-phosphate mannosyltransferase
MMEKLSIVIPAYNEEKNIVRCLDELITTLRDRHRIPHEIIVVNDNSKDDTENVVRDAMTRYESIRLVNRTPPGGFGRAIRSGIEAVRGDIVVVYMADLSDSPDDVVAYYNKILEGYDCVFGSRFTKGSVVQNYPAMKLVVNRIVNKCIQLMFWTRFNDLTNAFKAYRIAVVRDCGPYRACHFNLTLEMSLGALIRDYHITQIPIHWYGRTWGSSKLRLGEMGRRYLSTLLMMFFQRHLIADDLLADRFASNRAYLHQLHDFERRIRDLEEKARTRAEIASPSEPTGNAAESHESSEVGQGRRIISHPGSLAHMFPHDANRPLPSGVERSQ